MPNDKRKIAEISDAEEARIQAGIAADPDNPEWTEEDFKRAKPFAEAFPEMAKSIRRTRGRGKKPPKELVTLRLDPDVVEAFKADGPGWQSRVNDALRRAKKLPDRAA